MIDTHAHIYTKEFNQDLDKVIELARDMGVEKILMPNIDVDSHVEMMRVHQKYPEMCLPMAGIHPCDIKADYEQQLTQAEQWLKTGEYCAVGETGIDLYWDKTFIEEQKIAFQRHLRWGKKYGLPVVIHIRDSFDEVFEVVEMEADDSLFGVFHCFTGTIQQARRAIDLNFKLGIGGVLTFKNSNLDKQLKDVALEHMILETDSPYLAPVPFRGKRNEPSFVRQVAEKLAEIKECSLEHIDEITTKNAIKLFNLN